jgi:hypothetical protein
MKFLINAAVSVCTIAQPFTGSKNCGASNQPITRAIQFSEAAFTR